MKKNIRTYLRNVRSAFPVFQKNEKRFYTDFRQNVMEFEALYPNCNMDDLAENFGNPKEVIIDYFNNMDSVKYLTLMKKSFYMKIVTLSALVLLFLFFLFETYSLYQVRKESMEAIVTDEQITIIYETD